MVYIICAYATRVLPSGWTTQTHYTASVCFQLSVSDIIRNRAGLILDLTVR